MFHHTLNESIKGSEHIQGTDLLHFKYERSHRKFVGRLFHFMSLLRLPLCFTISAYKSTADKNSVSFNDSRRLIKELCLILFKAIFFSTHRMYATNEAEREMERNPDARLFISYATANEFQYLNYNLRGEKRKIIATAQRENWNSKSAWNEILRFIVWVELKFLFAHHIAFRRHNEWKPKKNSTDKTVHNVVSIFERRARPSRKNRW